MTNPAPHPSAYIVNNGSSANGFSSSPSSAGYPNTAWSGYPGTYGSPQFSGYSAGWSCESIAWSMFLSIACCEGVCVNTGSGLVLSGANRQWVLSTYAECLSCVKGSWGSATQAGSFRQAS